MTTKDICGHHRDEEHHSLFSYFFYRLFHCSLGWENTPQSPRKCVHSCRNVFVWPHRCMALLRATVAYSKLQGCSWEKKIPPSLSVEADLKVLSCSFCCVADCTKSKDFTAWATTQKDRARVIRGQTEALMLP